MKFDNRSGDLQGKSLGKASRASYRRDAKGWGDACKEGLDRAEENTNFVCQNAFYMYPRDIQGSYRMMLYLYILVLYWLELC